jgi:hypothetical protein
MATGLPKPDAKNFGDKIREFALIGLGLTNNKLDAFVTLRMLKDANLINISTRYVSGHGGTGAGGAGPKPVVVEPAIDLTPPPPPGGFEATAGATQILFETAAPVYRQGHGHARTKIYAAPCSGGPLPTFANAVLYTDFPGNIGVAPFDPASTLRLWATWTSVDGAESEPAGGTNGVEAETGLLEDQHIANMAVGKLLAGSLAVGQYVQSADYVAGTQGWRIATLAGGQAYLEINGNAGIGGLQVGATYIQSSNYVLNTTGFRLNANGTGQIGGFVVDTNAIRSSNYIAGAQGWRLAYDGTGQLRLNTLDAISANLGLITAGQIQNSTGSVVMNFNATGSGLLLRAGPYTYYGSLAGWRYPVEINADGSGFFGRGIVAGGTVKASGSGYSIPSAERPAILFYTAPPDPIDAGGSGP